VSQESPSESESIARSIALKAAKNANQQLVQEQIDFLHRQGQLQSAHLSLIQAQQSLLEREREKLESENDSRRIQNISERLRVVFEIALAVGGLLVAVFVVAVLVSSWHAQNVVISAFDVPAAMETKGQSGKVVASSLLDQLQQLQSETRSLEGKRNITDAWTGDVKLEIPQAHVSIGDVQRYLHDWLGRETHIAGSIVQGEDNNLVLTVRGNGFQAKSFSGKADTLPVLITQAAEYIYGASQTYRFGVYLNNHARDEESVALIKAAYSSALPSDRPLLLNVWGIGLADLSRYQDSEDKFREAVALKPDLWEGYANIMNCESLLQNEEAEVQTGMQLERLARRGRWFSKGIPEVYFTGLDQVRWDLPKLHQETADNMATDAGHENSSQVEEAPQDAQYLAQMHDRQAAELELQTSPGAGKDPYVMAQTDFVHGIMALDRGDYAQALAAFSASNAAISKSTSVAVNFTGPSCWLALAEEWSGQGDKADADIVRGGHLVDCYRFKASISEHRGDWALAQKQYAEAVALAPSIPSPYFSWGEALARHGDPDGAIAKFTEAHARGPHWADPLKSWGDALAAKQDYRGAVQRYEQSAQFAPNWGALHLRWGQALDKLGKHDAAVEQYRKALELDLTDAERKLLENCCT